MRSTSFCAFFRPVLYWLRCALSASNFCLFCAAFARRAAARFPSTSLGSCASDVVDARSLYPSPACDPSIDMISPESRPWNPGPSSAALRSRCFSKSASERLRSSSFPARSRSATSAATRASSRASFSLRSAVSRSRSRESCCCASMSIGRSAASPPTFCNSASVASCFRSSSSLRSCSSAMIASASARVASSRRLDSSICTASSLFFESRASRSRERLANALSCSACSAATATSPFSISFSSNALACASAAVASSAARRAASAASRRRVSSSLRSATTLRRPSASPTAASRSSSSADSRAFSSWSAESSLSVCDSCASFDLSSFSSAAFAAERASMAASFSVMTRSASTTRSVLLLTSARNSSRSALTAMSVDFCVSMRLVATACACLCSATIASTEEPKRALASVCSPCSLAHSSWPAASSASCFASPSAYSTSCARRRVAIDARRPESAASALGEDTTRLRAAANALSGVGGPEPGSDRDRGGARTGARAGLSLSFAPGVSGPGGGAAPAAEGAGASAAPSRPPRPMPNTIAASELSLRKRSATSGASSGRPWGGAVGRAVEVERARVRRARGRACAVGTRARVCGGQSWTASSLLRRIHTM